MSSEVPASALIDHFLVQPPVGTLEDETPETTFKNELRPLNVDTSAIFDLTVTQFIKDAAFNSWRDYYTCLSMLSSSRLQWPRAAFVKRLAEPSRELDIHENRIVVQNALECSRYSMENDVSASLQRSLIRICRPSLWENLRTTYFLKFPQITVSPAAAIRTILDHLPVPYRIDVRVLPLLDRPTLKAVEIVTAILSERVSAGLTIEHVSIGILTDRDAGQWSELVFNIRVNLDSVGANQEWDNVLVKVSEEADGQVDGEVAVSLVEKIGIHFTWKVADHVRP